MCIFRDHFKNVFYFSYPLPRLHQIKTLANQHNHINLRVLLHLIPLQHLLRPNLEINTEANRHQLIKIAPLRVKAVIVGKIILKAAVEVKIL